MQIVTLDELKQLLPSSEMNEEEWIADGISFKDACKTYQRIKDDCKNDMGEYFNLLWRQKAYSRMNFEYFKPKCPPIKLVGKGSSRTVYACIGGQCIKIAVNDAGVSQNQHELKHTKKKHWWSTSYECFVKSYDSNSDFSMLLSECCALADDKLQFAKMFQMQDFEVFRGVVKTMCNEGQLVIEKSIEALKNTADKIRQTYGGDDGPVAKYAKTADAGIQWLQSLKTQNSPGKRCFMQLLKFWKKNGVDELLPGDVMQLENWGYAVRHGKLAPVMIDVGFSKKVADEFYE